MFNYEINRKFAVDSTKDSVSFTKKFGKRKIHLTFASINQTNTRAKIKNRFVVKFWRTILLGAC